jgi:sortase A
LALETLPSYPIPTPKITATVQQGDSLPDTSPVTRLFIPNLGVDAEVKYVPFDGLTWAISGLQNEIAWMGETSWPGLGGNTGLAGHVTLRNGTAGPLYKLHSLQPGDQVILYTEQNEYIYTVREQRLVEETDLTVLSPTDKAQLTVITCDEWSATMKLYLKRRILIADLTTVLPLVRGN